MKKVLMYAIALALAVASCKTPSKVSGDYAFTPFSTECLGVDLDGSQTVRAWGKGNNKVQAIEQAKRNALRDIVFKGITGGSGECDKRPLVAEVNAQEKYEQYFNAFFAEGGAYNLYVRLDEKRTSRIKSNNAAIENWGVVVTVDRAALRERLIFDNIIKP